jgi:hypothetical protein
MQPLVRALAAGLAITFAAGCVFAPVSPPRGILWTDQTAPLFTGGGPGSVQGRADAHNILFLLGWGDAGLAAAMNDPTIPNGPIRQIRHTDYRIQNYLLIYQRYTTIVHGETTPAGPPAGAPEGRP